MGIIPGLLAGGAAAALFLGRSEYEKDCLVTDTYEIRSPKLTEGGRTLVFLTDLHDKEFGPGNRRLLEAIRAAGPDAVLIGGDMMVAKGKGELETSLRLIKALAGEFPVYCGNGNHELRMKNKTETYGNKYWEIQGGPGKNGGRPCFGQPCMPGQGPGPLRGGPAGTVLPPGNAVHGAGIYGKSPGKAR